MNKIKVIIEGYAHEGSNGSYIASPTTTLVESNGKLLLIDPGASQELLLQKLKEADLSPEAIDAIYLSHYHPDHFLAIRLFPNHDIYDGEMIWREDQEFFHKGNILDMDLELMKTPGHSPEDTSVLVETEKGKIVIAPDVFWWEDGKQKSDTIEDLLSLKDPFATDEVALLASRKKVLAVADWIIPGHGKVFKNPSK